MSHLADEEPASGTERHRRGQLTDEDLVGQLRDATIYRDYEHAFLQATGLHLRLIASSAWLPDVSSGSAPPDVCRTLSAAGRLCAACRRFQTRLLSANPPRSIPCHAGLRVIIAPIFAGTRLAAYLHTSHVLSHGPTARQVRAFAARFGGEGTEADHYRLEKVYRDSPVLAPGRHDGVANLLGIFAAQLSTLCNQIVLQHAASESPFMRRARLFISEHLADGVHLAEAARAMHVSTFYFCKLFKRETGLTFTDYLGRMRVEQSKRLLLDPHHRISEIAYDVGFGSLTHFNRVFRRLVGQSPTDYRRTAARTAGPAGETSAREVTPNPLVVGIARPA